MIAATLVGTLGAVGSISSAVFLTQVCVQILLYGPRQWWRYGLGMGVRIHELEDEIREHEEATDG